MARKFASPIINACLIIAGLTTSFALSACQSDDSGREDVPLDVQMVFRDDKPYRQPDLARWNFDGGTGETKLAIAPATNQISAAFKLPRTPGTDTVKLSCWRNGLLAYVVPAIGDANLTVQTDKVAHKTLAQSVLLRQSELHLDDPDFFGDDTIGARRTYAKMLVDRDTLVAGYPVVVPEGVDTMALLDDICVAMTRRKLSFDSLYSPEHLGRDSAAWHGIVLARIAAKILTTADSAVLFPPAPVRVQRTINVKNALVAGGDESGVEGVFGWFPGMVALDAVVLNASDTTRGLFDVAILQPQDVMDTIWNLDGRATIRARSAVAAGDYELRIVARDVKGHQAESRTKFTVVAPPSEVPRLVRREPEGGDTVRLPFSKPSIRVAFAVWKPENVKSESFTIAGLAATRESDSVWSATVAVPPTAMATIVAVRVLSKEDQPGTEYLFVVRDRDQLPPEIAPVAGNVDREVPFDSAYADVGWVVKDDHMVGSVEIGGVAAVRADSAWMRRVKLAVGENVIRLAAKDSTGNAASKEIKIVRLADTEKPKLVSMLSEQDLEVYGDAVVQVAISFQATDNHRVDRVLIDGEPALRSVAGDIWSRTVVAKDGDNKIVVRAWDSTGNENSDSVVIHKISNPDRPIVHTAPGTKTQSVPFETREIALSWVVLNPKCLKQVTISDKPVQSVDGRFTLGIELPVGDTTVVMRAEDTLGNSTTSAVKITRERDTLFPKIVAGPVSIEIIDQIARVTASWVVTDNDRVALVKIEDADATRVGNVYGRTFDLKPGQDKIRVYAQDGFGNTSVDSVVVVLDADTEAPEIVEGTGTKSGDVGQDVKELLLNWIVTDNRSVAKVMIGGVVVEGVGAAFGRQVKLEIGKNTIQIDAWDAAGNKTSTSVEIVRLDQTGPTISDIQGLPAAPVAQGTESVVISFKLDDETGVGKVTVGGVVVEGKDGVYTAQAPLRIGSNSIEIVAIDKDGTSTTKTLVVVRNDEFAPVVVEKNPSTASVQDDQATYDLAWTVSDNSGTFVATLDGKPLACAAGVCAKTVDLAYGENTFTFVAQDASGNKSPALAKITRNDTKAPVIAMVAPVSTTAPVVVTDAAVAVVLKWTFSDNVGVASSEANGVPVTTLAGVYSLRVDMAAKFGDSLVKIVARDVAGNVSETTVITVRHADVLKPEIKLLEPSQDTTIKDAASYVVKWIASDNSALASLKINTATVTLPGTGTYSQSVALSYGANTITIVAKDAAGNDSTKVLKITRVDGTKPTVNLVAPLTAIVVADNVLDTTIRLAVADDVKLASVTVDGVVYTMSANGAFAKKANISKMYGDTVIKVVARDLAGNVSDTLKIMLKRADATPPVLVRSTGALDRGVDTSVKSTSVAWTATDNDKIQSVSINGVPVTLVGGKYSVSISIKPGWNRVVVVAKDAASNETRDTIQIVSCVRPAIAAGGDFAIYLKPDGNIVQHEITGAPEDQDIVQIAAAGKFAMALGPDGMVRYFGPNPVSLDGLSKVRYIAGGGDKTAIAIKDDSSVVVWGDATEISSVKDVPVGLRAIAVAIGRNFCAAIRASDSMLVVWGDVPAGLVPEKVKAISLRLKQLVAIKLNGDAVVWGGFTSNNSPFIAPLESIPGPISAVTAGFFHSIYLNNTGAVSGFGWNAQNRAQPGPQPKAITAISVGYRYSLLLDVDGGWSAYGVIDGYTFTLPAITP